jgi:hypothetical protein
MTVEREKEIIQALQAIVEAFIPTEEEPVLTTHGLISRYNKSANNAELIGGNWAQEKGILPN